MWKALYRSSPLRCSIKEVFLKIPQNWQENICAESFFLIKLQTLGNSIKKRFWHRCFPVNFAKFLRTTFLQNTSGRLLLIVGAHLYVAFLSTNMTAQKYNCEFGKVICKLNEWTRLDFFVSKLVNIKTLIVTLFQIITSKLCH